MEAAGRSDARSLGAAVVGALGGLVFAFATFGSAFWANIYQDGAGDASAMAVFWHGIVPTAIRFWLFAILLFGIGWTVERNRAGRAFGIAFVAPAALMILPLIVIVPVVALSSGIRSLLAGAWRWPHWDLVAIVSAVVFTVLVVSGEAARST